MADDIAAIDKLAGVLMHCWPFAFLLRYTQSLLLFYCSHNFEEVHSV